MLKYSNGVETYCREDSTVIKVSLALLIEKAQFNGVCIKLNILMFCTAATQSLASLISSCCQKVKISEL